MLTRSDVIQIVMDQFRHRGEEDEPPPSSVTAMEIADQVISEVEIIPLPNSREHAEGMVRVGSYFLKGDEDLGNMSPADLRERCATAARGEPASWTVGSSPDYARGRNDAANAVRKLAP